MPLKFGDGVVKVQRLGDGSVSRVNAIVLGSSTHVPMTVSRKPIEGAPEVEHIDLAYPDLGLVKDGHSLKTRSVESIFRLAYDVAPYKDQMAIGYEPAEFVESGTTLKLLAAHAATRREALAAKAELDSATSALNMQNEFLKGSGQEIADLEAELDQSHAREKELAEKLSAAVVQVPVTGTIGDGKPSAQDLDKNAEEQKIAAATESQPAAGESAPEASSTE